MEQNKIVDENFLCSGQPMQVAKYNIQALDVSTGYLYLQKKVPYGSSWSIKDKNYFQPIESVSDGDKGDITVSMGGAVWTIDDSAVTYAKMQSASGPSKLIGSSSVANELQEIILGAGLVMTGDVISTVTSLDSSKDFTYTGDNLTLLTCFTDSTKTTVKYTKSFTYDINGNLDTSTVTYGAVVTVYTYIYDMNGDLTNINQT